MKAEVVHVRLSELHTQQLVVPPWEVPVLQAVHGDADVQVVGSVTLDRELPEPTAEYERLERRYGRDSKSEQAYVAMVYGQFGAGIANLERAMLDAHERAPSASAGRAETGRTKKAAAED